MLEDFPLRLPQKQVVGVVVAEHVKKKGGRRMEIPIGAATARVILQDEPGDPGNLPEVAPGQLGSVQARHEIVKETPGGENAPQGVFLEGH